MRRVSILSGSNKVDVYKSLPTLEDDKTYTVKIEQLSLPKPVHDSVFETELLTLERRLKIGRTYSDALGNNVNVNTIIKDSEPFIPTDCNTVEELVYQLNRYLRKSISVDLSQNWPGNAPAGLLDCSAQEHVPVTNWYQDAYILDDEKQNNIVDFRDSVQALVRQDGKLYIMFTPFGARHYAIRLTDKGKEILGHDYSYFMPDPADNTKDTFNHSYLNNVSVVLIEIPTVANTTDIVIGAFKNNLYHHELYRDEIVIESSLPFQHHLFANTQETLPTPMIASFRLKQDYRETQYQHMLKTHHVTSLSRYNLQTGHKTHNTFTLSHTKLQNFHLQLIQRSYVYNSDTDKMETVDKPYIIPEGNIWMLRLAIS